MNNINFINPIPPKKQEEITRWYGFSLILIGLLLSVLISITGFQLWHIKKLHQDYTQLKQASTLSTIESQLIQIKKQETLLENKMQKINALMQHPKKQKMLLNKLAEIIPPDVALLQCKLHKDVLELEGHAFTTNAVLSFLHALRLAQFKDIHITSMMKENIEHQSNTGLVQFAIKGKFLL